MTIIRYGAPSLQRKIDRWKKEIIKDIKRVVIETAAEIESNARALAPVDTGYLRQSITTEILNDGFTAKVTVDSAYAIYVIYGTRRVRFEQERKQRWLGILQREIRRVCVYTRYATTRFLVSST